MYHSTKKKNSLESHTSALFVSVYDLKLQYHSDKRTAFQTSPAHQAFERLKLAGGVYMSVFSFFLIWVSE